MTICGPCEQQETGKTSGPEPPLLPAHPVLPGIVPSEDHSYELDSSNIEGTLRKILSPTLTCTRDVRSRKEKLLAKDTQ